jgi:hypothetical protein
MDICVICGKSLGSLSSDILCNECKQQVDEWEVFRRVFIGLSSEKTTNISDDEYAVYSSFIMHEFDRYSKNIIISQNTDDSVIARIGEDMDRIEFPTLLDETYDSFIVQNKEIGKLSIYKLPSKVYPIKQDIINVIFSRSNWTNGWDIFYLIFPSSQGITSFSRVGFSTDKSQALLFSATQRNYLVGSGNFYVFSKKDGKWSLSDSKNIWIS